MTVVTRFAPSPTGYLHIGGARTALFNWLFARHHGGQFLLRIEDTDRARSTDDAINAIFEGLKWFGLDWDKDAIFQFARAERHREVALELLEKGHAYYCYTTPQELEQMREQAKTEGRPARYDGRWRDRDSKEAPHDIKPVVRLKAPLTGETKVQDLVQGDVNVSNTQLDDMVLLRADGTPTYMLAVVVDDHDMDITHVIRGDDHLTNAFRQLQIYNAMGWTSPQFAHIPLIHGSDGAKLSKRHGALGVEAYRDMGFLPEAMQNYLLRLGWSHGDDEIISQAQAIKWFDLDHVGKSPSRFDVAKLTNLNAHYMREAGDARLVEIITPAIERTLKDALSPEQKHVLMQGMEGLKSRAKTTVELETSALFYVSSRPLGFEEKALAVLTPEARVRLRDLRVCLEGVIPTWNAETLEQTVHNYLEANTLKMKDVAQPLRAALTGSLVSPGLYEIMAVLGPEESLGRIRDALEKA